MGEYSSSSVGLAEGKHLYVEGDQSNEIFQLVDGQIIFTRNNDRITKHHQRGHPIGVTEAALRIPRQFTVRATENTRLKKYELQGKTIYDWIESHPLTGLRVIANVAYLLDKLNDENKELFDLFRNARTSFKPLIEPLLDINSELNKQPESLKNEVDDKIKTILKESSLKKIIRCHRTIINSTGRSVKQAPSDVDVPADVKETFESGDTICEEGENEETFYVLLEGMVSVIKEGQRVASIDESGSIFGEMSAILDGERTATIEADIDCTVAAFPREKLREIFQESSELGHTILQTFHKRLQRAVTLNKNLVEFSNFLRNLREANGLPDTTRESIRKIHMQVTNSESDTTRRMRDSVKELKELLSTGLDVEPEALE